MRRHLGSVGLLTLVALALPPALDAPSVATRVPRLPLIFEPNVGQVHPDIRFFARAAGHTLYLTAEEATVSLYRTERSPGDRRSPAHVPEVVDAAAVRMRWLGGSRAAELHGRHRLPSVSNYLVGSDPAGWRRGVPHYAAVRYEDIYPGIDLEFRDDGGALEYDFLLEPGADPGAIRLRFDGADAIRLDDGRDLVVEAGPHVLRQRAPVVYQERPGAPALPVDGRFLVAADGEVTFALGAHDATLPLVIDPKIVYSTYLGRSDHDQATDIAEDGTGSVYVSGLTCSTDFPTKGAGTERQHGVCDAVVFKLDKNGRLKTSTHLGGSESDTATVLALGGGAAGGAGRGASPVQVYVAGFTDSLDFPEVNPVQERGSVQDQFVSILDANLATLLFSTPLGGSFLDTIHDIIVGPAAEAIVVGVAGSDDFPLANPTQGSLVGSADAFVTVIDPALGGGDSSFVFSTYFGGKAGETAMGVALGDPPVARAGAMVAFCIQVVGSTASTSGFPLVNEFQRRNAGDRDGFIAKWCGVGAEPELVFSSYYGGSGYDELRGIERDGAGRAVIGGLTESDDFPTQDPTQEDNGGRADAVVAVFDLTSLTSARAGSRAQAKLLFATYFGGFRDELFDKVAVDAADVAYLVGSTDSFNVPTVKPLQGYKGGDDLLVVKVDYGASALNPGRATAPEILFATPYGGTEDDTLGGIDVDAKGTIYIAGETRSANYPTRKGAQKKYAGQGDAIVTAIKRPR